MASIASPSSSDSTKFWSKEATQLSQELFFLKSCWPLMILNPSKHIFMTHVILRHELSSACLIFSYKLRTAIVNNPIYNIFNIYIGFLRLKKEKKKKTRKHQPLFENNIMFMLSVNVFVLLLTFVISFFYCSRYMYLTLNLI